MGISTFNYHMPPTVFDQYDPITTLFILHYHLRSWIVYLKIFEKLFIWSICKILKLKLCQISVAIYMICQGTEKVLLSGSKNQNVKIICKIWRFSGLPGSPKWMGSWNQAPRF